MVHVHCHAPSYSPALSWQSSTKMQKLHSRLQLGHSISRKHLLKHPDPSFVIRRGMDLNSMVSTTSMAQIEYLNTNTLICADSHGLIEVHRFPVCESGRCVKIMDVPSPQNRETPLKLFGLSDGCSFAVGLQNGDYQIYFGVNEKWSEQRMSTPSECAHTLIGYNKHHSSGSCGQHNRKVDSSLWACMTNELPDRRDQGVETFATEHAVPTSTRFQSPSWAFHESGSTLLSAFVDADGDCFSIMDYRVKGPVACFTRSRCNRDYITACTFISDQALATSHLLSENSNEDCSTTNTVSVWDLRSVTHSRSHPVSSMTHRPHFPNHAAAYVEPAREWILPGVKKENFSADCRVQTRKSCNHKLESCYSGNKIMMLSQPSDQSKCTLVVYDYIREVVTFEHFIPNCTSVAVTPSLNQVAIAHTSFNARQEISIVSPFLSPPHGRPNRKRFFESDPFPVEASGVRGSISPTLKDELGIPTRLTCLSWNSDGTSLAGGSLDGDLFVWGNL